MFLMIGGNPRSGTTLLQTLCHFHPDVAMTNEFGSLVYLGSSYDEYARQVIDRWKRVKGTLAFDISYYGNPRLMCVLNLLFAYRHLYHARRQCQGGVTAVSLEATYRTMYPKAKVVGDKWPHYLFRMGKYVQEKEITRLVIYRDCRDVTSSTLVQSRTNWKNTDWVQHMDDAEKIATLWVRGINIMEKFADKLIVVQYEALMHDPAKELKRVSEAIGLDPAGFRTEMIDPGSIGKYHKGLSHEELETVMRIAGPTMDRLGYLS